MKANSERYRWNPPSSFSIALVGQVLAWKQCLTDRTPSLFIIIFTSVCISYFQWPLVNLGLVSKLHTIPSTINTWLIWHTKWGLERSRMINHGLFFLLFKFFGGEYILTWLEKLRLKASISTHSKPHRRLLKCFILITLGCKIKH